MFSCSPGRAASLKRLGSARPSSEAEPAAEGKAGEAALRRQDIPAKPGSMLTQHGSGSLPAAGSHLDSRPSSLDLGLLPPREMQVWHTSTEMTRVIWWSCKMWWCQC